MAEVLCSPDMFAGKTNGDGVLECGPEAVGCSLCASGGRRAMLVGSRRRIRGWGMEDRCYETAEGEVFVRRVIVDAAEFAEFRERATELNGCNERQPSEWWLDLA